MQQQSDYWQGLGLAVVESLNDHDAYWIWICKPAVAGCTATMAVFFFFFLIE